MMTYGITQHVVQVREMRTAYEHLSGKRTVEEAAWEMLDSVLEKEGEYV
jgi:hypothetical protein